jgi:hypothetical protein
MSPQLLAILDSDFTLSPASLFHLSSTPSTHSSLAKVEATKVFLGILKCDILPADEDRGH